MGKHAYLIMAHHRPDLLAELISALDDIRNDIYIHIDKKADASAFVLNADNSRLILIDRMNVNWGGYSQIECEYKLFQSAYHNGPYDYYHLLTGSCFPLYNQNYIHSFFEKNAGKEFVGFEKNDYTHRVEYYYAFNEIGKKTSSLKACMYAIRSAMISVQKALNYNRLSKNREYDGIEIKKGLAYVSVTNDFVKYLLDKRLYIKKLLSHSFCGDEVFIQTLMFNSHFKSYVYDINDEYNGCKRNATWETAVGERKSNNFIMDDLDFLLNSANLFALKFEGPDGMKLISAIKSARDISI